MSKIMWLGIGVIIACIALALVMFVFLLQWIAKGIDFFLNKLRKWFFPFVKS